MVNFIKHHVIHRFGVPKRIIHDNGLQFASQSFYRFCDKYQIQNVASTAYNPAANKLAEVFTNTIIKLLEKFVSASEIGTRSNNDPNSYGSMPFSLVYECEASIPLEIQMSSLRIALATKMTEGDNDHLHLQELKALDEKRLQTQ